MNTAIKAKNFYLRQGSLLITYMAFPDKVLIDSGSGFYGQTLEQGRSHYKEMQSYGYTPSDS